MDTQCSISVTTFPQQALCVRRLQYEIRAEGLGSHVMCAATYVTPISLRINDVIGWASAAFYVERGSQRSQWRFVRKLS